MRLPAGKISPFGRNDNMGEATISWLSTQMERTHINYVQSFLEASSRKAAKDDK
jgi:hypothetical protein